MSNVSNLSATRWRLVLSQTQIAATLTVYVIAAVALWWWYPPTPVVVHAGPDAQFYGFTPDRQSMVTIDGYHRDPIAVAKPLPGPKFIRFWNVRTGEPGLTFQLDKAWDNSPIPVKFIGFSKDGQRLFIGNQHFSVETGKPLPGERFCGNSGSVTIESPDGSAIADSDDSTTVADGLSGAIRFQVPRGLAAAFSADGQTLAVAIGPRHPEPKTGALRWTIKFFDPLTGDERRTFAEAEGAVRRMEFSPNGDKLALAVWQDRPDQSSQMGIQLWDVTSGAREQTLPMDSFAVNTLQRLQFLTDGQVITTEGVRPWLLFAWDTTVPSPDNLLALGSWELPGWTISPDGRQAALWDRQSKEIIVRRLGIGKQKIVSRREYSNQNADAIPIVFTPDGRIIVHVIPKKSESLSFARNRYEVIDAPSGELPGSVPLDYTTFAQGVSPDGRTLVSGGSNGLRARFTLWDIPTPTPWLAVFGWSLLPAGIVGLLLNHLKKPAGAATPKS